MVSISLKADVSEVTKSLSRMHKKQIPFAVALGITRTAVDAKEEIVKQMKRAFNAPTPFTLRSVRFTKARKNNPQSVVFLADKIKSGTPAGKYLMPQIHGGGRRQKAMEVALKRRGLIGRNQYVVPGREMKLNKYGNITKAKAKKILDGLRAGGNYFVARIGKVHAVWERYGKGKRKARPILIVLDKTPKYGVRLPFYDIAGRVVRARASQNIEDAMRYAIETAR